MKKCILSAVFLLLLILTACGAQEEEAGSSISYQGIAPGMDDLTVITERTEFYDIITESENLFDLGLGEKNSQNQTTGDTTAAGGAVYYPVGVQFFMGEPVQLWAEVFSEVKNIYLYKKDGSSQLLLQDAPGEYISDPAKTGFIYLWYLDRNGDFYCCYTLYSGESDGYRPQGVLVKILSTGEILYQNTLEKDIRIEDVCQTEDGGVYLLLKDEAKHTYFLTELDPDTGEIISNSQTEIPYKMDMYIGSAGDLPAVTGFSEEDFNYRIMKADTGDGSLSPIMYFTGTSYGWHQLLYLQDIQVLGNGQIELLWTNYNGSGCVWERLRMEKVKKTPILLRGRYNEEWLSNRIAEFNRANSTYYVIIQNCGFGNDKEDFARLTSIQIGAGKGPDIVCGDFLSQEYITGMLEKGALEDLRPYMEASGILEEEYFPFVFNTWRQGDRIYGVSYKICVWGEQMDEEVLGSRDTPDIETLADALLAWEGNDFYYAGDDSKEVLKSFLVGTESLWGMVDWESGSCDFDTPLFAKLLEAARRYGDDGRRNTESGIMEKMSFYDFFDFDGSAEQEAAGKVTSGRLFDDGCRAVSYPYYTLAINTNSSNKEGAWEFISYLIGAEAQGKDFSLDIAPIHKGVFDTWMQERIEKIKKKYTGYVEFDISEKKQEEYKKAIEEARPLPMRTAPIVTIILDEAEDYFTGSKSAEEVSKVINNRVQLYLDERK